MLEQQYLEGLQPLSSEWREEFLSIWVRKESYMKFCGEGLRMGLSKFSVLDAALDYAGCVQAKNYPAAFVSALDPGHGLYAAAALGSPEELESIEVCVYEGQTEKEIMDEAADLLAGRAYLSADLQKKLRSKGYRAEEAEDAVNRLQELGYLDIHPFELFPDGSARQADGKGGWFEFTPDLFGSAVFAGRAIPCISVKGQRLFHTGYELRKKDIHDLEILSALD